MDNNFKIVKVDSQSRDWCFTINHPKLNEQELYDYLKTLSNIRYFVFVREKGDGTIDNPNGTEHHQGYIEFSSPKKFSTVKNYLSEAKIGVNAHISQRKNTRSACVKYVKKIDLFLDKAHTHISDIYEFGEFAKQGKRTDITDMVEMKNQGARNTEIFESYPNSFARYKNFVEEMSNEYKSEHFKRVPREIEVVYIYGKAGVGKTRFVMDKYGYENVFRLTDYGSFDNPNFDEYNGQDVVVFEEFRSSIKIEKLLNYLDIYPITLPARYHNKTACYTKVYIITNIPLTEQYQGVQEQHFETWQALIRRIHKIYNFDESKEEIIKNIKFRILGKDIILKYNEISNCYNCEEDNGSYIELKPNDNNPF
jgi:hypothetical protein